MDNYKMISYYIRNSSNRDDGKLFEDITDGLWFSPEAPEHIVVNFSGTLLCFYDGIVEEVDEKCWSGTRMYPYRGELILKNS